MTNSMELVSRDLTVCKDIGKRLATELATNVEREREALLACVYTIFHDSLTLKYINFGTTYYSTFPSEMTIDIRIFFYFPGTSEYIGVNLILLYSLYCDLTLQPHVFFE